MVDHQTGNGNILRVLEAGLHICHMLGYRNLQSALDLVTDNSAKAMHLGERYGLEQGRPANLLILSADSDYEVIRSQGLPLRALSGEAEAMLQTMPWPGNVRQLVNIAERAVLQNRREPLWVKAAGVDEVWCVAVNDVFVMGAWGRDQKVDGKVRMLADGSAEFAQATGLTLDLTARGLGLRSNRYSMLVKDGVVKALNIEGPGQFEVSDADTLLAQIKAGV